MVPRRAIKAGVVEKIGNHSFRGTGITTYLENEGTLELAQEIANHASPRTTKLYDRRGRQDFPGDGGANTYRMAAIISVTVNIYYRKLNIVSAGSVRLAPPAVALSAELTVAAPIEINVLSELSAAIVCAVGSPPHTRACSSLGKSSYSRTERKRT
jgi:hypothetical protein